MSREDILKNKFEFLPYQKFRDSEYMNRFLLMVEQNKQSFFEGISQNKKHESFVLKDDIFYISDGKKSYAFKLDEYFDKFVKEMIEEDVPVFLISFIFPDCEDLFDFSFIADSF